MQGPLPLVVMRLRGYFSANYAVRFLMTVGFITAEMMGFHMRVSLYASDVRKVSYWHCLSGPFCVHFNGPGIADPLKASKG